jgi:hypothetical protein
LRIILVARHQRRAQAFIAAACDKRTDDVIRFVLRVTECGDAGVLAEFAAARELQFEILGSRVAIRLVRRVDLVAKRGGEALVEGHCDVARLGAFDEVTQEACKTERGVRWLTVAVHHVRRHGVIGTKYIDRRVD